MIKTRRMLKIQLRNIAGYNINKCKRSISNLAHEDFTSKICSALLQYVHADSDRNKFLASSDPTPLIMIKSPSTPTAESDNPVRN